MNPHPYEFCRTHWHGMCTNVPSCAIDLQGNLKNRFTDSDAHLPKVFQGVLLFRKVWLEHLGYFLTSGTLEKAPDIDAVTSLRRSRMTTWRQPVKWNHRMSLPAFNPKLSHSAEQKNPCSSVFHEMQLSCAETLPLSLSTLFKSGNGSKRTQKSWKWDCECQGHVNIYLGSYSILLTAVLVQRQF